MIHEVIFTTTEIRHDVRKKLELTLQEYCFLDFIYQYQTHPDYAIKGYCAIDLVAIANHFGMAEELIRRMADSLRERRFYEESGSGMLRKTTGRFYRMAYGSITNL